MPKPPAFAKALAGAARLHTNIALVVVIACPPELERRWGSWILVISANGAFSRMPSQGEYTRRGAFLK